MVPMVVMALMPTPAATEGAIPIPPKEEDMPPPVMVGLLAKATVDPTLLLLLHPEIPTEVLVAMIW